MPYIHSPPVWQGRGKRVQTSITPAHFLQLQPHDFFSTLSLAHTKVHTNVLTDRLLPSARKRFPTPAWDTPLFGIPEVVMLLLVSLHAHTPSSYLLPESNRTQAERRKPSTKQRSYPAKGDSAVPCESQADATKLSHFTGLSLGRGWSLRGVSPPMDQHKLPGSLF